MVENKELGAGQENETGEESIKKLTFLEKWYLRSMVGKLRKKLAKNKTEKNEKKYQESIDSAKASIIHLMELIELEKDDGTLYTTADIHVMENEETEEFFEEVLEKFGKMIR